MQLAAAFLLALAAAAASPIRPAAAPAQAWQTVRSSLGEAGTRAWTSVRDSVGGATTWLHSRRLNGFNPTDLINFEDPAASVAAARALLCTDQTRNSLGELDSMVQQALPGAKPLGPVLDAGWDCLCSDFTVTPEYGALAKAVMALFSGDDGTSSEAKAQAVVGAVKALIPVIMGEQGLCSNACKTFAVQLGDWAIGSVAWETLSPDLAFLPPLTNLAGLPASAMSCACSAISWTEFATMLTADGFGEILGAIGGGDAPDRSSPAVLSGLQLNGLLDGGRRLADGAADGAVSPLCAYADNWDAVTAEQCAAWVEEFGCDAVWAAGCPGMTAPDGTDGSALRLGSGCPSQCPAYALEAVVSIPGVAAALRSVIKYPAFLLSGDGVCADGCSAPFKQVTQYVLDVATAVLGREASLQPVSSAVAEISASDLHTCTCGGSFDWDALVAGVSSAIDAFATETPLEVPGMLLGAVFGPSFLCSSPTCKAITGDFMNVISSLSAVLAPDGTGTGSDGSDGSEDVIGDALAAVGDIELCPADAGSAGFSLKQTFVLLETLESFSPAKQEEFKARFITELNKGTTTIIKLTTSSVTLAIRAGSINVDAEIACSQPDLAEQVQTQMDTMASTDTAELSTRLGVEVAAPPTKAERGSIAASESQNIGGDDDGNDGDDGDKTLILILSIVGASVALILLAVLLACCCCRRGSASVLFRQDSKAVTKEAPVVKGEAVGGNGNNGKPVLFANAKM